jgi:hypothetical protein
VKIINLRIGIFMAKLNRFMSARFIFIFFVALTATVAAQAQQSYFFPAGGRFNAAIPTPEQFLGYPIGSHHTRYDRVVSYFQELDRLSDRVALEEIGQTHGKRMQIVAKITAPANHARLEQIRQQTLANLRTEKPDGTPVVIQLGYNVHGNEASGAEAALLTAYFLTASEDEETMRWLDGLVILLDPVYNPDGRDRFANWVNMHKASPPVSDGNDREHNEVWPGSRTNHYWFDLNRDWFLGVHPESQNRLRFFHQWRPYVMVDHHEMGTNSTFYFDPGKSSSNNPLVPAYLYDTVYPRFATYFETALNSIGSQYFTKEAFDKLYPGYGSSYANFYGGAGFLFEQASSRGHLQETTTVPLSFAFTIRNQLLTALATVRASFGERDMLFKLRSDFYKSASAQAKANPVKAYVVGEKADASRTQAFVNLLLMHQVEVFQLPRPVAAAGRTFEPGSAFVVPVDQPNYLMVRSAFEKQITYTDSIFYDASAWSLVQAFNLPHAELRAAFQKGDAVTGPFQVTPAAVTKSNYAYVAEFTDYRAHQALHALLSQDVVVKTAFRPFTVSIQGANKRFGHGSLIIPVHQQRLSPDAVFAVVQQAAQLSGVAIHAVPTGLNAGGIDLGSNLAIPVKKVKALMLVGAGVNAYEAGEVWHLLDQRVGMPITKVDLLNFGRVNLTEYTTIVMVSGTTYPTDKPTLDRIKSWVQNGGTLITLKNAGEWAMRHGLVKEKLPKPDSARNTPRIDFDQAANREGARQIGGAIFQVDVDITHPVGFGLTDRKMPFYRNGRTFLPASKNPYNTVAQYTASPLIGGYVHKSQLPRVANSAAILVSGEGQGRVILFSDNPNFRAYWYGTNKLFLNALFFGPLINPPASEP